MEQALDRAIKRSEIEAKQLYGNSDIFSYFIMGNVIRCLYSCKGTKKLYIIIGKKGLEYSSPFEAYCNAHLAESFFKQAQENYFATSTANIK